jgi:hypothetical protein
MGRPRKPTNVLELTGAFRKNPSRAAAREHEPRPADPLVKPPASFNPETSTGSRMLAIWHELVSQAPDGVLTTADAFHVELTCRLMFQVRIGSGKAGDYAQLNSLLGKMGLNPADRSKISVSNEPKEDKFESFMRGKKRG